MGAVLLHRIAPQQRLLAAEKRSFIETTIKPEQVRAGLIACVVPERLNGN